MRVLALLLVLLSLPAFAADYTPWPGAGGVEVAQAQTPGTPGQPGQGQQGGKIEPRGSLSGGNYPGRYCCVHCRPNEVPCGGVCMAKDKGGAMCKKPAGCACSGKP